METPRGSNINPFFIRQLQLEYFGSPDLEYRSQCGPLAKARFILWVIRLLNEKHWQIDDSRSVVICALNEVANI